MRDAVRGWRALVPASVRARITLVATLVFAAAFTLAATLLVHGVRGSLEQHARQAGTQALSAVKKQIEEGVGAQQLVLSGGPSGVSLTVVDTQGNVVAQGGGVPVGRFEQMFLGARAKGQKSPKEWAKGAWEILRKQNQAIIKDGAVLQGAEANLEELNRQHADIIQRPQPRRGVAFGLGLQLRR